MGEGDDLASLLDEYAGCEPGEILVCSQKVVSKAEGRVRRLDEVEPDERAREVAEQVGRDPRLVALVLAESREVLRAAPGRLIVETHSGWVCANAGIDASNAASEGEVILLPADADASARRLRAGLDSETLREQVAVIVSDSFGRAWRLGQADVAIGCAGIAPISDLRGTLDSRGMRLEATMPATADQVASAADLCRDKDGRAPAAVVSGLDHLITADDGPGAVALQRPRDEDLFR